MIFKSRPPLITVTVGKPVMPGEYVTRDELRDRIHGFMTDTVNSNGSYEYIKYRKKDSDNSANIGGFTA